MWAGSPVIFTMSSFIPSRTSVKCWMICRGQELLVSNSIVASNHSHILRRSRSRSPVDAGMSGNFICFLHDELVGMVGFEPTHWKPRTDLQSAATLQLCRIPRDLARPKGFEPSHGGSTIHCVRPLHHGRKLSKLTLQSPNEHLRHCLPRSSDY